LPPAEGTQWGQELVACALKARAGGLGLLVLLELTLQDVDTEIDRFLEAVACFVDKEVCTIDLELDGCFLVVRDFGLDNLWDGFGGLYIVGEAGQLLEFLLDKGLELLCGIEVDGLNSDVHS